MKLACVTDCISRNAGGMHTSVRRLMQSMKAGGDDVHVFTVNDQYTAADQGLWTPLPVAVSEARGPRRLGYAPELSDRLLEFDPDALSVHGLWTYTSVVSSRWHRHTGRPVVIHPHGMLDPWAVRNAAWKKRLAGWMFEHRHLREASCLRALCQAEAEAMRAFGLTNTICIIPNGIDLPLADPSGGGTPGPKKVLLYLGRLHPKKGLVHLITAWSHLMNRGNQITDWMLAIAGWDQNGHEETLKRHATELGVKWSDVRDQPADGNLPDKMAAAPSALIFLGPQFGEQKERTYRLCDAFILPSFSEGLPMVILDAWAHGKAVLMTPMCNLPEGFTTGSAIEIQPDSEAIFQGLITLSSLSPAGLEEMGRAGLQLVKSKFTWPQVAAQLDAVNRWLVHGERRPDFVEG